MNQNSPNREYLFRRRDGARTSLPRRMQDEVCYAAVECWRACSERCVVDDDNASTLTAATHDPCHPTTPPSQLHCLHLLTRVVVDTQRSERDEKLLLITLSLTSLPLPPRRPLRSQPGVSDGDSPVSRRQQITFRATLIFHLIDGLLSTTAAHEVRRAGVLACGSCHLESSARPHPHRA